MATYKDIDFNFKRHPLTNDLVIKTDANAIKQSLENLINTNYYERGFNVGISSNIRSLLFENYTELLSSQLKDNMEMLIANFEPRIEIISIDIDDNQIDSNLLIINISYYYLNKMNPESLSIKLFKTR